MTAEVVVEGRGLHAAAMARVTLRRREGATTFNGEPIARYRAILSERSTTIATARSRARTVEHLFAALAALRLWRGIDVELMGPEPPIADGGAAAWMDALASVGAPPGEPAMRIVRDATIPIGRSRYTFSPSPCSALSIEVELELDDPRLVLGAAWSGDEADFRNRIAPARTFCFAHELEELARKGLASHVAPEAVVVIGKEILAAGRPFEADEPARHKLLDLVGDLFLYGGPPHGTIRAFRPGHSATHEALRAAIDQGIVAR